MTIWLIIAAFVTGLISGVFGLLGGMIMMGLLLTFLSVPSAMLLHATMQLCSNTYRCWLWRHDIVFRVLPWYLGGVILAGVLLAVVSFIPDKPVAFFLMGILPLLSMGLKHWLVLSILRPSHALLGGLGITFVQLTTGVVGPLLDVLYVQAPLTRQQIIATKAFTQASQHVLRLIYYGGLTALLSGGASWPSEIGPGLVLGCIGAVLAGTYSSTFIVHKLSDQQYRRILTVLITIVSLYCLGQSAYLSFWLN